MDTPIVIPGLGAQLTCVLKSLNMTSEPTFSLKCKKDKIYLDIVWSTKPEEICTPTSGKQDLESATPCSAVVVTKPSEVKSKPVKRKREKKKKSPSARRRDQRRLVRYLARKKNAGRSTEKMQCDDSHVDGEISDHSRNSMSDDDKLDVPEVLERERKSTPPAFGSSDTLVNDTEDADLFSAYTETPIMTCWCSLSVPGDRRVLCTLCFRVGICERSACKYGHQELCRQFGQGKDLLK